MACTCYHAHARLAILEAEAGDVGVLVLVADGLAVQAYEDHLVVVIVGADADAGIVVVPHPTFGGGAQQQG